MVSIAIGLICRFSFFSTFYHVLRGTPERRNTGIKRARECFVRVRRRLPAVYVCRYTCKRRGGIGDNFRNARLLRLDGMHNVYVWCTCAQQSFALAQRNFKTPLSSATYIIAERPRVCKSKGRLAPYTPHTVAAAAAVESSCSTSRRKQMYFCILSDERV